MNSFDLNINKIEDYIIDSLYQLRCELTIMDNIKFHHNTSYQYAPLICEYGILPLLDLNMLGIRNDSKETLEKMDDIESHINGNSGVSLAIVGLKDLYEGESEYDPFDPSKVDFTLDNSVIAHRNSCHYGNEYICSKSIGIEKILTADVRIIEYIDRCKKVDELVDMYNSLIEIARVIDKNNLDIKLREMSYDNNFSIDTSKLALSKEIKINKLTA